MSLSIQDQFRSLFQQSPDTVVKAPGRINLIGEHVDYLEGLVMPAAIDRSLLAAARQNEEPTVKVWTELMDSSTAPAVISLDDLSVRTGSDSWLNYLIGVIATLREAGVVVPGFEVAITADLPTGAGLSSSAALETATSLIVESLTGVAQDPVDRALICQKAEHDYAGVPCGIMDQLAVGASRENHALMIDCRDLSFTPIPIPDHLALVVADSRVKHALGDGEYRKRREDCEMAAEILGVSSFRDAHIDQIENQTDALGPRLAARARHAVTEIGRVRAFASALEERDEAAIGELMRASHQSLRDDFEVSCPELDALVEAAYSFGSERGLVGSRMTGGGFGGSTISLVKQESADAFAHHLEIAFAREFSHAPSVFVTRAAKGASIIA